MRKLILLAAVLLCAALTAQAQVAAPTLAPMVRTYTSTNPAAQQWGAPSHIALALGRGDTELSDDTGAKFAEGDASLGAAQLRWVGERFSLGAEYGKTKQTYDAIPALGGGSFFDLEQKNTQAALAGQIGDMLSLGIGWEKESATYTVYMPVKFSATQEGTMPVAGASLRLAEAFFLGAAYGKQSIDLASGAGTAKRNVTRYGVGFRQAFGNNAVHLEVFQAKRDAYDDPANPGDTADKVDRNGYAAEISFGSVLLSYVADSTDSESKQSGVTSKQTTDIAQATVGWVPAAGWAVLLKQDSSEMKDESHNTYKSTTTSLGAALRF